MAGPWPDYLTGLEHAVGSGPEYWRELRGLLAHDWAENVVLDDDVLRRITCPALVCHGDRDRVQPLDYAEHLAAGLPDAELFVAEGAGHARPARAAGASSSLERSLERVSSPSGPQRSTEARWDTHATPEAASPVRPTRADRGSPCCVGAYFPLRGLPHVPGAACVLVMNFDHCANDPTGTWVFLLQL